MFIILLRFLYFFSFVCVCCKNQRALIVYHLVFGINFQIHFASLTRLVSIHLLIHLSLVIFVMCSDPIFSTNWYRVTSNKHILLVLSPGLIHVSRLKVSTQYTATLTRFHIDLASVKYIISASKILHATLTQDVLLKCNVEYVNNVDVGTLV